MARSTGIPLAKSAGQDLLAVLMAQSPNMTSVERRITADVLANAERAAASSITALATRAGVSEASIVRFCRALGFRGYPDFRLALAADAGRRAASEDNGELDGGITAKDSLEDIIRKIGHSDARAIEATVSRLDVAAVSKLIREIAGAGTIGVVGVGASGFVALDLQLKLNRLGRLCLAWTDAHTALTSMAALSKRDVLIAISHSGSTPDIVDIVRAFKARGVRTALITNNPKSPAAAQANTLLLTSALETEMRSGATASRIAQLTVVDCLCVGLAHRDLARTRTAIGESRAALHGRRTTNES